MATNPMQKKARNAFLSGVVVMLLIAAAIGVVVYLYVIAPQQKKKKESTEEVGEEVLAYVLTQPVTSGQVITQDMLSEITVYKKMIPTDYVGVNALGNIGLNDQYGNVANTDPNTGELYIMRDNNKILIAIDEGGYYIVNPSDNKKEYMLNVPLVAKVNMSANTILSTGTIAKSNETTSKDVRLVEFNMITLPVNLVVGDVIDIRISMPTGQTYIVVSKKTVESIVGSTIELSLSEYEQLMMNCAMVEGYKITASNIYAVRYKDPGIQEAAIPTYPVNADTVDLIRNNANIVAAARNKFATDHNKVSALRDTDINPVLNQYADDALSNVEEGIQEQIEKAREEREAFVGGLETY